MRTPKKSYMDIAKALGEVSRYCLDKTGSYSNVTGAYEYMLADMVADLSLAKQEEFLRRLARTKSHIDTIA